MKDKIEIIDSNDSQSESEFYAKFKTHLNEVYTFPAKYIYKFIIPTEQSSIALIHAIFENTDASFSSRDSKTGKYTSLTIGLTAKDADTIINFYQEVATIKGVVML